MRNHLAGGSMLAKKSFLALIASAALISGCGATDSTDAALVTVETGTYKMTAINDATLPANVSDGQSPVWVNSGSLTLDSSGTYKIEVSYQRMVDGNLVPMDDSCSGTWTRTTKTVDFQETGACNGAYSGTAQNGVLTVWLGPVLKVEYRL
ncbi:MAG TPA: hypothetical protein VD758_13110 [Gemmatimonadaceae bacterium]|nr:hypothetical protein [Gemmatimonadaceae bacterium]